MVIATTLSETDGKTAMSLTMRFSSKEARDGMIASGMEGGQSQAYERLDEILAELYQRDAAGPELVISREFDAPKDLVWKAWTDPSALAVWWAPAGSDVQVKTFDLRPGGMFHYNQKSPNGPEIWGRFVYREVSPTDRLVFVNSFSDVAGGLTSNPWVAGWPLEVLSTLTLEDLGGRTRLTIHGAPMNASVEERQTFERARTSLSEGFAGTFQKLEAYLAEQKAAAGR